MKKNISTILILSFCLNHITFCQQNNNTNKSIVNTETIRQDTLKNKENKVNNMTDTTIQQKDIEKINNEKKNINDDKISKKEKRILVIYFIALGAIALYFIGGAIILSQGGPS